MKYLKLVLIGVLAFVLALKLFAKLTPQEEAIEISKKIASKLLKDPDSAKFEDIFTVLNPRNSKGLTILAVCGVVNGKNSFGAYAGGTRFVSSFSLESDNKIDHISTKLDDKKSDATVDSKNSKNKETVFEAVYWNPDCVDSMHEPHYTGTSY